MPLTRYMCTVAGSAECSYFVTADKELNSAIRKSRLNMTPVVDILDLNQVDKFADNIVELL